MSVANLKRISFSSRSEVIRGSQNFEIRSRDARHAHLGVVLWSFQILSQLDHMEPSYGQKMIVNMASVRHLEFGNF